jgi:hypothetical protein
MTQMHGTPLLSARGEHDDDDSAHILRTSAAADPKQHYQAHPQQHSQLQLPPPPQQQQQQPQFGMDNGQRQRLSFSDFNGNNGKDKSLGDVGERRQHLKTQFCLV